MSSFATDRLCILPLITIVWIGSMGATSASQGELSPADNVLADEIANRISTSEWLGPLAPIAISPFFGITCLALMNQFDFVPENSFVSNNPVLQNPTVLWVFLTLTILTSLPRLTKVSKPLAQALDQVEAYSGIITLLVLRIATAGSADQEIVALQMGYVGFMSFSSIWSIPVDILMSLAAIMNVVVINSVKFFFEVLVWLVPFPFIDALLEAANKSLCAALMALYAYSPLLATLVNLVCFAVCLLAFFWIRRRITYMRTLFCDPIIARLNSKYGVPEKNDLIVFPKTDFGPFPAKAKLHLSTNENGWQLTQNRIAMRNLQIHLDQQEWRMQIKPGLLINQLEANGPEHVELLFSQRYGRHLTDLAERLNVEITEKQTDPEPAVGTA